MMTCAYCKKDIAHNEPCAMIQDNYSAWMLHPTCYDKYRSECEALAHEALQATQQLERVKLAEWNALSMKIAS